MAEQVTTTKNGQQTNAGRTVQGQAAPQTPGTPSVLADVPPAVRKEGGSRKVNEVEPKVPASSAVKRYASGRPVQS
jgi:hypothetical protein